MLDGNFEQVGFWGLLLLYVVRDAVIPMANKYFPSRIKVTEREQDRNDKEQEFIHQMRRREVEAIEAIAQVVSVMSERLSSIEKTQTIIVSKMPKHKMK